MLIELEQVFRQKDAALLEVLNRSARVTSRRTTSSLLNGRVHPDPHALGGGGLRHLDPHQRRGRTHQSAYLNALPGTRQAYQAGVAGEFNATRTSHRS